jgi:hypothetical protein
VDAGSFDETSLGLSRSMRSSSRSGGYFWRSSRVSSSVDFASALNGYDSCLNLSVDRAVAESFGERRSARRCRLS